MRKTPVLIHLQLPQVPFLEFETIKNPINDKSADNEFGIIQVNDNQWTLLYDTESEIWWVSPRPKSNFYEILYTKLFYSSPLPEQFGYASLEQDGARRIEKATKNWDDIEINVLNIIKNNLLEIGCGSGEFLLEAVRRGWKNVCGNELEDTSAQIAKSYGLKVNTGFFEDLQIENNEKFDLIFADNVIEHAMNPLIFIQKAYSISGNNGLLILRLPDTQPFGPTLKLIDHTFHFSRKSIKTLVEKAGYKVENIFYSGTFKGNNYELDDTHRIDNMTVVARKL